MDLADLAGYSLRRQLGSGSAGTVWQVRDRATGRNAVLKHIPAGALPDSHRVREDLTKLARLRHPHLARLVEFRETDTGWLLISQHLAAGTLTALLTRRGPLTKGELVTLLTPLASALSYLHDYGLTHGSITPNNIMFDADGRPILTDPALHAGTPEADTQALSHLAHQAGADPHPFASTLFTTPPLNSIPTRLLTLAQPAPIELAIPPEGLLPTPAPPPTTPTPEPTPPPPPTQDPLPTTPPKPNPTQQPPDPGPGASPVANRGTNRAPQPFTPTTANTTSGTNRRQNPPTAPPDDDDPPSLARNPLGPPPPNPAKPRPTHEPQPQHPAAAPSPKRARVSRRTKTPTGRTIRTTRSARLGTPHSMSLSHTHEANQQNAAGAQVERRHLAGKPKETAHLMTAETAGRGAEAPRGAATDGPVAAADTARHRETGGDTASDVTSADAVGHADAGGRGFGGAELRGGLWGDGQVRRGDRSRRVRRRRGAVVGGRRFGRFTHPAYGVLAAVAAGAVVVLVLGIAAVRTVDTSTTAQPESHQPQTTLTQPTGGVSTQPATEQTTSARPTTTPTVTTPGRPPTSTNQPTGETTRAGEPTRASAGERLAGRATIATVDPEVWMRTLEVLDAQRSQAFWSLDAAALDKIYLPGSSPWVADRALLASYRKQNVRVQGLRITIVSTTIAARTATTITLRTVDHLTAGEAVDRFGARTPFPAGQPSARLITLTAVRPNPSNPNNQPWRITTITRA